MNPFLRQVAQVYVDREKDNLIDYCFVFPNKRSATFFREYLREVLTGEMAVMPEITTISELTASFSDLVPATRFEQLFILYNRYKELSSDIPDFDKFLYWGDMLISDFNDVDRYLVDPASLFVNVKRLKEINANYLTEEQLDIIRRYWGDEMAGYKPDEFWSHVSDNAESGLQGKFLKLWEILLPLYDGFRSRLRELGLTTEGMMMRDALELIRREGLSALPFKRYIFVGFNVLSAAEIKLFERLKLLDAADFYWDFNSPAFEIPKNKAARFMRTNIERFPSRYEVDAEPRTTMPDIRITCVPSRSGMVKVAGEVLRDWVQDGTVNPASSAPDTAVVLPEEDLFIPMIHSVPSEMRNLNVTMGFPLRYTPMSSLLTTITIMQVRARETSGDRVFLLDDVRDILSHPAVQAIDHEACTSVLATMSRDRMFLIPSKFLMAELPAPIASIFDGVDDINDPEEVYLYTRRIIGVLMDATGTEGTSAAVERCFLEGAMIALEELHDAVGRWGVQMRESTFFHLLRRSIASASVNFIGEPLKGLQIMGVLETRALDFDNIIILSMNERVFPRKHFTRSFIPDTLRRAFGMSTIEFQESIYAYYFYRLISRASRVELLYDGRTEGARSGEMSRFISQLLYLFPGYSIDHRRKVFSAPRVGAGQVSVVKTPDIMKQLDSFRSLDPETRRNLSASAINTYIDCPLNFYLRYVCGLDVDDPVKDYMDSSTFGTIIHEVLERMYMNLRGDRKSVTVTSETLDGMIASPSLDILITESINDHFLRRGEGCREPLKGQPLLLGRIMAHFIKMLLKDEKQLTPFDFLDGEKVIKRRWKVNNDLSVNIRQVIDRIDRVNGVERVVDYKTGEDVISFSSIGDLFDRENPKRRKALVQLLFYCNVYAAEEGVTGPLCPTVYIFKTLSVNGLKPVTYKKEPLTDYRKVNDEFLPLFNGVLEEIFNPDVPFTQPEDNHACTFCSFKSICGRDVQE